MLSEKKTNMRREGSIGTITEPGNNRKKKKKKKKEKQVGGKLAELKSLREGGEQGFFRGGGMRGWGVMKSRGAGGLATGLLRRKGGGRRKS